MNNILVCLKSFSYRDLIWGPKIGTKVQEALTFKLFCHATYTWDSFSNKKFQNLFFKKLLHKVGILVCTRKIGYLRKQNSMRTWQITADNLWRRKWSSNRKGKNMKRRAYYKRETIMHWYCSCMVKKVGRYWY